MSLFDVQELMFILHSCWSFKYLGDDNPLVSETSGADV